MEIRAGKTALHPFSSTVGWHGKPSQAAHLPASLGGRRAAWMRDSGAALLCSREGMGRCAPHQPVAASGRPHDMHTADPLAPLVSLF